MGNNIINCSVKNDSISTQIKNDNQKKISPELGLIPGGTALGILGGYTYFNIKDKPVFNQQKNSIRDNFNSFINKKIQESIELRKQYNEEVTDKDIESIRRRNIKTNKRKKLDEPLKEINEACRKKLGKNLLIAGIVGTVLGFIAKILTQNCKKQDKIENINSDNKNIELQKNINSKNRYWKNK